MDLFSLSSAHMRHLSSRQMVLARNVANISTPGYKAQDVTPFEAHLRRPSAALSVSNSKHIQDIGSISRTVSSRIRFDNAASPSGNNVTLETEIQRAGDVRRLYETTSSITKSFHKMFLAAIRA